MFDAVTVFAVSSVFALLSGAALALGARMLPRPMQPSARDWWMGTLLLAVCLACFAWMRLGGAIWVRLSGNIFWFLGVALYWRSIRRFFAVRDNPLVFFAAGAGVMGSVFFLIVLPHFSTRIALVTLFGSLPLLGAAYTLWRHRGEPASPCGWVLIALFIGSIALLIVRTGFFLAGAARADAMVESKSFALSLAPVLLVSLPIVGTTAFVLLCLERVHRGLADPRVAGASRKR